MRVRGWLFAFAIVGAVGCAAAGGGTVTVRVDVDALAPGASGAAGPVVEVIDQRRDSGLERTSLGVKLGTIVVSPPETEVIRDIVRARAAVLAGDSVPQIQVAIEAFDIETPSTPLYWDVDAAIELAVRVDDRVRTVAGRATRRTYVWPSEKLLNEVTRDALALLVTELDSALVELSGTRGNR